MPWEFRRRGRLLVAPNTGSEFAKKTKRPLFRIRGLEFGAKETAGRVGCTADPRMYLYRYIHYYWKQSSVHHPPTTSTPGRRATPPRHPALSPGNFGGLGSPATGGHKWADSSVIPAAKAKTQACRSRPRRRYRCNLWHPSVRRH